MHLCEVVARGAHSGAAVAAIFAPLRSPRETFFASCVKQTTSSLLRRDDSSVVGFYASDGCLVNLSGPVAIQRLVNLTLLLCVKQTGSSLVRRDDNSAV